ncbi:MAG: hypothetical protein K5796_05535 [Lachnospiraceae bacterium]|nr:hypothetical protein [Lachnospiraceae bacterium]
MRITNKIIQNNSLTNINTNKTLQDKLSTMISTEKKITRPSDDPIIALRSLRLRTSVNQTDQYKSKNVEDAKSWLTVTEDAIDTLSDIITDVRKQYTKGTSDPLTASDRKIILENLESLAAEIYNTGNADFAGRSVFTGYRTDTTLTVQKDSSYLTSDTVPDGAEEYTISGTTHTFRYVNVPNEIADTAGTFKYSIEVGGSVQTFDVAVFNSEDPTYNVYAYVMDHPNTAVFYKNSSSYRVYLGDNIPHGANPRLQYSDSVFNITETKDSVTIDNVKFVHKDASDETKVSDNEIMRIRLSYDKLVGMRFESSDEVIYPERAFKLTIKTKSGREVSTYTEETDPNHLKVVVRSNAIQTDETATPPTYCPQDYVLNNPDQAVFIPETGEILLGADILGAGVKFTADDIEELSVDYRKGVWEKGDLRPQHYFKCTDVTDSLNPIEYNHDSSPAGEICYNIGVNQSIRINTTANECFSHNIVRDIHDVIRALKDVENIEENINSLEKEMKALNDTQVTEKEALQAKLDAAGKAQTFLNEKLHSLFSSGITKADGYLAANNLALTDCGTRSKRLELIENRLNTQLSTLKELKSENEDADMAETAIRLTSAKYAYDASLMATSKSIQQTLLNYI